MKSCSVCSARSRLAATCGWCARSQSIALACVFMVSSGCIAASHTMPSECAPEASGISQNQ